MVGDVMGKPKKPLLIIGAIAGLSIVGFLAFAVFGVQTLFLDDVVDEASPFAVTTAPAADGSGPAATADRGSGEVETTDSVAGVIALASGVFADGLHPTSGDASVITDGSGVAVLRFENFVSDNGPDLNVYLRSSSNPDDFIDLGDLKGNIGNQNYELPAEIDLAVYDLVDIWCVRFGVSFGSASLST